MEVCSCMQGAIRWGRSSILSLRWWIETHPYKTGARTRATAKALTPTKSFMERAKTSAWLSSFCCRKDEGDVGHTRHSGRDEAGSDRQELGSEPHRECRGPAPADVS